MKSQKKGIILMNIYKEKSMESQKKGIILPDINYFYWRVFGF